MPSPANCVCVCVHENGSTLLFRDADLCPYHVQLICLCVCGRPASMHSAARASSLDGAGTEAPTPLVLPFSRPSTTPGHSALPSPAHFTRATTHTPPFSPSLGKTLWRTTTTAFDPSFFGKTLGRTETSLSAAMFGKTLGRSSSNMMPFGKTLGRTGTLMSAVSMSRTLGRGFGDTMRNDFGATQAAAPPLAIDPLVNVMLQKAALDIDALRCQAKRRNASPAFQVTAP